MDKQMERVIFLSEMVNDLIDQRLNHKVNWDKWREEVELKGAWRAGDSPEKPSNAEIKRLMLVLRQETIKLDRMMTTIY